MSGETVLVVEDDLLIRFDIVDALLKAGFDVLEAGNVAEAVALLGSVPGIKAVFTDVGMPDNSDGLAHAQKVRDEWPPIAVLLTSEHRRVTQADLPEDGRFLPKPYQSSQVVANLNDMVHAA